MNTEEQALLGTSSGKGALTTNPPLDSLAKTIANGTISRKRALKLMGAGAAVASLALAGWGDGKKGQARGSTSGACEPSGGSTSNTTVGQRVRRRSTGLGAEAGELGALPGGGPQLAFLGEEGVGATFEFLALALELGELQYSAEVGVKQPFPLAFGMG